MAGQICRDMLMDSSKSGKPLTCALLQAASQVNDGTAHPLWVHPVADQDVEGLQVKEAALAVMQRLHALHISQHMSMLKSSDRGPLVASQDDCSKRVYSAAVQSGDQNMCKTVCRSCAARCKQIRPSLPGQSAWSPSCRRQHASCTLLGESAAPATA